MAGKNTRNYAWHNSEIRLGGVVLTAVEGVAWNHKQEKEVIYGKGTKGLGVKKGNEVVDGSISFLQDELERVLDSAPDGKIINLDNIDLQVAFEDNGVIVRYSIIGLSFTEEPHDHKQNDKVGRSQVPFIALDSRRL